MPTHFRTKSVLVRGFLFLFLIALGTVPLFGQVTFSDFSDVSTLSLNGIASQATNTSGQQVLRLTEDGINSRAGTAWFNVQQQSVTKGFTSVFQFQITHDPGQGFGPADGMAFVLQNSSTSALGGSGSAIGYGAPDEFNTGTPIPNSLAVEFDTYQNSFDPNANHIAVQSCGTAANNQDHTGSCALGIVSDLGGIILSDGAPHLAIVEYDPPVGDTPGILRVFLDNSGTPILTVNTDLSTLLDLGDNGTAWVGFTGATGGFVENSDVLNWTFTPATAQTTIVQTLASNPEPTDTNYVFGSYNHKLEYSNADSDNVAVTAIPISQSDFHLRLVGTPFANAQCAIYEGTGGLCVLFRVVCTLGSDCTTLDYSLFNNFNTDEIITGAGLLKATIGENDWQNIIETFTQTRNDPGTTGKSKGFSDFIICQNCTANPAIQITSPPNGGFVAFGQSVPITFSCTPDATAPNVTLVPNSCLGMIGATTVHSGDTFVFNTLGPASMMASASDSVGNTGTGTSSFTVGQAPAITSANNATFQIGVAGSFLVTTTGSPVPSLTEAGALPGGVTFVDNHNGTGTLSGTPTASGVFNLISFTAHNALNPDATQNFTLTVNQAPAITSANNATFQLGVAGSFTVTTTGFPTPSLTEAGALPAGVTFVDNHNGTGKLSGTPTASGVFNLIKFTAHNAANPDAVQNFTLTVNGAQLSVTPTSINFGTVYYLSLLSKNVTLKNNGNVNVNFSKIYVVDGPGADFDDYFFLSFCGYSLAPGKSCTITVFFWADDLGSSSATLNIADNATGSPQQVSLSATVIKKGH